MSSCSCRVGEAERNPPPGTQDLSTGTQDLSTVGSAPLHLPYSSESRIMSVDALRGFDMFWIAGGGEVVRRFLEIFARPLPAVIETQLEHVEWEGFVAWDLIMPLFLFIVGVSMPLSISKRLAKGQTKKQIYLHTLRRFAILWILGMFAQGNLMSFDLSKLHLYSNTLQAIAAGYLVATVVILNIGVIGQAVTAVALLIFFWLLMTFVPVPGHGAGLLTPDGNLAMFVDETILGHFRDGTPYTWILSSIPFAASVLLGVLTGHLMNSSKPRGTKLAWLIAAGIGGLALGQIAGLAFPIIKHIWTSSFVLYAAGWSWLLLALFYGLIDILGYRKWAFVFVVLGMNAIVVYVGTGIVRIRGVGELIIGASAYKALSPLPAFLFTTFVFALIWSVFYMMYRKKIFVRI